MNTNELLSFENISNLYGLLERQTSIGNEAEIIHHKQTMEQLTSVTPVILYSVYTMGEGMSETCNTEYPYVSEGDTGQYNNNLQHQ